MKNIFSLTIFAILFLGLGALALMAAPSGFDFAPGSAPVQTSSANPDVVNAPTAASDFNWVTLPLSDASLAMASDLKTDVETVSGVTVEAVQEWNSVSQSYQSYTTVPFPTGDFALQVGGSYRIAVSGGGSGITWSIVGDVPDPSVFVYTLNETAGSDLNWFMLPLDKSGVVMASDIKADIEANSSGAVTVEAVQEWNATAQSYQSYTTVPFPTGDFPVRIGYPYRVSVSGVAGGQVTWPSP